MYLIIVKKSDVPDCLWGMFGYILGGNTYFTMYYNVFHSCKELRHIEILPSDTPYTHLQGNFIKRWEIFVIEMG
jgi:hypothetical protein